MVHEVTYALKYGPLIECLSGRNERAWLENYPPEVAEHFRKIDERAIRDYLSELRADFEVLYRAALPSAIDNASLAESLNRARHELLHFERLVRSRVPDETHAAKTGLRELLANMQALHSLVLRPIL